MRKATKRPVTGRFVAIALAAPTKELLHPCLLRLFQHSQQATV